MCAECHRRLKKSLALGAASPGSLSCPAGGPAGPCARSSLSSKTHSYSKLRHFGAWAPRGGGDLDLQTDFGQSAYGARTSSFPHFCRTAWTSQTRNSEEFPTTCLGTAGGGDAHKTIISANDPPRGLGLALLPPVGGTWVCSRIHRNKKHQRTLFPLRLFGGSTALQNSEEPSVPLGM